MISIIFILLITKEGHKSFLHHKQLNKESNYNGSYKKIIDEDVSGFCGDNLSFTIHSDSITFSGTGNMVEYSSYLFTPWNTYSIRIAIFEDGVTSIGSYAFDNMQSLISINISDSVTSIGVSAFLGQQDYSHL